MSDGREPVLFSWSGGKDSMLALHVLLDDPRYEVAGLLTTVAGDYRRISHHGVREELLRAQACALDLPLEVLYLPAQDCTNAEYEACLGEALARRARAGVRTVAHGDLFLEDLRAYRERSLARVGMRAVFPIWGRDTRALIGVLEALGYRAVLCCVDAARLGPEFAGRAVDAALLADLPADVDPCGENGEYHSFVWDGPRFRFPVPLRTGELATRAGRHFIDLLPDVGTPVAGVGAGPA